MRLAPLCIWLVLPGLSIGQAGGSAVPRGGGPQSPGFSVASVKPNPGDPPGRMVFQTSPTSLTARNMPLRLLIQRAYNVRPFQISGAPAWLDNERFDFEAKSETVSSEAEIVGPMLQKLLEYRFALRLRRETREAPVLDLVLSAGGKLVAARTDDCADRRQAPEASAPPLPCHEVVLTLSPAGARLRGEQASVGQLAVTLANIVGRPVIDRTGFPSRFDLDVEVSMDGLEGIADMLGIHGPPPPSDSPSLFTALPRQLGLKLNPGRGPVELLVIEHVDRPSGN